MPRGGKEEAGEEKGKVLRGDGVLRGRGEH